MTNVCPWLLDEDLDYALMKTFCSVCWWFLSVDCGVIGKLKKFKIQNNCQLFNNQKLKVKEFQANKQKILFHSLLHYTLAGSFIDWKWSIGISYIQKNKEYLSRAMKCQQYWVNTQSQRLGKRERRLHHWNSDNWNEQILIY